MLAAAAAVVFLLVHVPYLPQSLEDLDSINFALGVQHFDVGAHQPHPPGYPVFILAGKAARAVMPSEAKALALLSIAAGALGIIAIAALSRRVLGSDAAALGATALAAACPLYWFTAGRPLSDMTGLAAAIAVETMTLAAASPRALAAAAFCAGLAAGIRSQVVWLTLPLLAFVAIRGLRRDRWRRDLVSAPFASALSYLVGVLAWAIPLVLLTGGPAAYWRTVFNQGAEDLTGIQMLWTTPSVREFLDALYYAFAAPWATWLLIVPVLAFVVAGIVVLARRNRSALVMLAVAFGPYLAFDIVFQETFTTRYALPLVVPLAFLAAAAAAALPRAVSVAVVVVLAGGSAHVGGLSLAAYARQKAPAFRLLDDMRSAAGASGAPAALAMDRREALDLRRPIQWQRDAWQDRPEHLLSPPQREWLELVKYWNDGGSAPVWYVADPLRTDIDLVQHDDATKYRWQLPFPVLLGGVRPNEMDWYRIARPEWYVGEGWALTPESAGVSRADRRGPSLGGIDAWITTGALRGAMLVGGRNFRDVPATITIDVVLRRDQGGGNFRLSSFSAAPGFFVKEIRNALFNPPAAAGPMRLSVRAEPGSNVAIEQFDASATRPLVAFGDGWHEAEFDPSTGRRWRWTSDRGELRVRTPAGAAPLHLHIEGESPRRYFPRSSHVTIRAGAATVYDATLAEDFSIDAAVPSVQDGEQTITIATDQVYAPADRSRPWRRSGDRRRLGLRIFKCELTVAASPAS